MWSRNRKVWSLEIKKCAFQISQVAANAADWWTLFCIFQTVLCVLSKLKQKFFASQVRFLKCKRPLTFSRTCPPEGP